ncbi:hypothetical protein VZT92_008259 [Zoarces viviparus]|uniref:Uncharacterized protein n=1 Tax=Zoarces viviparus TaxID=48416 RepID=A0AAW1FL76_ZOAVI
MSGSADSPASSSAASAEHSGGSRTALTPTGGEQHSSQKKKPAAASLQWTSGDLSLTPQSSVLSFPHHPHCEPATTEELD